MIYYGIVFWYKKLQGGRESLNSSVSVNNIEI